MLEEIVRTATVVSALVATIALVFSAYQFFRGRYEQKAILTIDKCRTIAEVLRKPSVVGFLLHAERMNSGTQDEQEQIYKALHIKDEARSDWLNLMDELELFAFLYRRAVVNRKIVDRALRYPLIDLHGHLKGLIARARKTNPGAYGDFLWLCDRVSRAPESD